MQNFLIKTVTLYKEAYSGHPREVWDLAVLTFINRLGTLVLPFLTVYLTTVLNFPLDEAGLLAGAFGIGSLIGSFLGGKLSDKLGPNIVIIYSLLISGLLLIFLQYAFTFYPLFILITLTAMFGEAYRPAMSAAVGSYVPPKETGRTMAFLRLAINLGFSAAPAIGGFVASYLGYVWLFWIDGLTCILAGGYFWYVSTHWEEHDEPSEAIGDQKDDRALHTPAYRNTRFLLFLLITFFVAFSFTQWFNTVPVFIKSVWEFDERYLGIIMTLNGILIVLIEMPATDQIEKTQRMKQAIYWGLIFISVSFIFFLFHKSLVMCVMAMFFVTMGEILYLPFNNSEPLAMSPVERRGEYMAWYWMTWSLANVIGPTFGFSLIDAIGYRWFWMFILVVSMAALVLNARLQKIPLNSVSITKV